MIGGPGGCQQVIRRTIEPLAQRSHGFVVAFPFFASFPSVLDRFCSTVQTYLPLAGFCKAESSMTKLSSGLLRILRF